MKHEIKNKEVFEFLKGHPSWILKRSCESMKILIDRLPRYTNLTEENVVAEKIWYLKDAILYGNDFDLHIFRFIQLELKDVPLEQHKEAALSILEQLN